MGLDMYGWIEVNNNNYWWAGVINIDFITPRTYSVFYKLFGFTYAEQDLEPIAPARGLPEKYSDAVKNSFFDENNELDYRGVSWVLWSEIKDRVDWIIKEPFVSHYNWNTLFNLMLVLAETYGDENVRLVAGFSG
jgi:hypothetical protein